MSRIKITVNDSINCKPDVAIINMNVSLEKETIEDLNECYNKLVNKIKHLIKVCELSDENLSLGYMQFNKSLRDIKHEKGGLFTDKTSFSTKEIVGYTLTTTLQYKIDINNKDVYKLYSLLLSVKYIKSTLCFDCENTDIYKDKLLENLLNKAKHKVDIIATTSGMSVKRMLDVDYSVNRVNVYYNDYSLDSMECSDKDFSSIQELAGSTKKMGYDISDSITVTYELE